MKVIIYPRVSSLRQAKDGDSIDAQINRLKSFCEEKGYEVVGTYTDAGKSASISDDSIKINVGKGLMISQFNLDKRPAFKRLLEEAKSKKFEGIVFYRWDRFSRSSVLSKISQIYFERYNIQLIPSDDSLDPLMVEIKGALSEEEVRKLKERVRSTRLNQFSKGVIVGRCPIGYVPIFKNKRDRKGIIGIKPDKKKSLMIKDIFKMTSEGIGYSEICSKHKLKPQSYYNIIKNSVYLGLVTFEGETKKGNHEPIIKEELFKICQKKQ